MEKVLVGMSGGVDSSVAAYLLKEQGYEVIGVTMNMWPDKVFDDCNRLGIHGVNDAENDAKKVADLIGIKHLTMDFKEEFKCHVIDNFIDEYTHARTPNPCVMCNRYVKWEAMLKKAESLGASYIATGHYARIDRLENGRFAVRNSVTAQKDQTYALYQLTQEQLKGTLFPVGEYTKDKIREIAAGIGMNVAAKSDSMEICFIPDNDYASYVCDNSGMKDVPGNFVDKEGNILGKHKGIIHYTIGQRKGLGIALGKPVFVTKIDATKNEVCLGNNDDLFVDRLVFSNLNFMGVSDITDPVRAMAKIRYNHKGEMCTVRRVGEDTLECVFDKNVRAVTPGQSVVLYDGEYVMGGGII